MLPPCDVLRYDNLTQSIHMLYQIGDLVNVKNHLSFD